MLKEGTIVKVHIYPITAGTFVVKREGGKLGIDYNVNRLPYTSRGELFVPFEGFASSVIFEDVATGKRYHYSNLTDRIDEQA